MSRSQANMLLLLVSVIWGSAFIAQKQFEGLGQASFTGLRFLLGALVVLPFAWREWRRHPSVARQHIVQKSWQIVLLGSLLFMGSFLQQIGVRTTSVTNAGFLTGLYVPLVPLFGWLMLKERPHILTLPLALVCLFGIWLLSGMQSLVLGSGDNWVIASTPFWAIHILFIGRVADRLGSPLVVAVGQFVVVGIWGLLIGGLSEPISLHGIAQAGWALAYAGILSSGVAFTLQVVAQRYTPAPDAAIVMSSEALFSAVCGAMFLNESLSLRGLIGCGVILFCIITIQLLPVLAARRAVNVS